MHLAIVSDFHVPGQADEIPDPFRDRIETADHVVHAGDAGSHATLAELRDLADEVTAVYGNADPNDIPLPAVASVTLEDVTFVVTHGMVDRIERAVYSSEGVVTGREDWLDAIANVTRVRAEEPRVGVGGHSHDLEDDHHDGIRLLNPGSATGVGRAGGKTMLTADVDDGAVDVTVHEL